MHTAAWLVSHARLLDVVQFCIKWYTGLCPASSVVRGLQAAASCGLSKLERNGRPAAARVPDMAAGMLTERGTLLIDQGQLAPCNAM